MAEMEITTVGERGQVIIPKRFREKLKIKPHEKIVIIKMGNKLVYERIDDFLTDEFINILKKGLEGVTWEDIEKFREEFDEEVMERSNDRD